MGFSSVQVNYGKKMTIEKTKTYVGYLDIFAKALLHSLENLENISPIMKSDISDAIITYFSKLKINLYSINSNDEEGDITFANIFLVGINEIRDYLIQNNLSNETIEKAYLEASQWPNKILSKNKVQLTPEEEEYQKKMREKIRENRVKDLKSIYYNDEEYAREKLKQMEKNTSWIDVHGKPIEGKKIGELHNAYIQNIEGKSKNSHPRNTYINTHKKNHQEENDGWSDYELDESKHNPEEEEQYKLELMEEQKRLASKNADLKKSNNDKTQEKIQKSFGKSRSEHHPQEKNTKNFSKLKSENNTKKDNKRDPL